jgi:hypothetical protein
MTSIERTAYPRFKRLITARELHLFFSPGHEESEWAVRQTNSGEHQLALLLMLKSYQRMGCFPKREEIPEIVVDFVRRAAGLPEGTLPVYASKRTAEQHRTWVRRRAGVRYDGKRARELARETIRVEAESKNNPADLINVALEKLVEAGVELPAFSTLDHMASTVRAEVNAGICAGIWERIGEGHRAGLLRLLDVDALVPGAKSPFNRLKQHAQRATWSHFKDQVNQLAWVDELGDTAAWLGGVAPGKVTDFAGEAAAADAGVLRDYAVVKRVAVMAALAHKARMRARDDLVTMFCKRVAIKVKKSRDELEEIRRLQQAIVEALVANYRILLLQADVGGPGLGAVTAAVDGFGGFEQQYQQIEKVSAHHGDNWEVLLYEHLQRDRALAHSKRYRASRDYIPALDDQGSPVDTSFTTQNWQKIIRDRSRPGSFVRRHFEAMVFCNLADELRTGDVAVAGSEEYADWSAQLLSWQETEARMPAYLAEVGLREEGDESPFGAAEFRAQLEAMLTAAADSGYPETRTCSSILPPGPDVEPAQARRPARLGQAAGAGDPLADAGALAAGDHRAHRVLGRVVAPLRADVRQRPQAQGSLRPVRHHDLRRRHQHGPLRGRPPHPRGQRPRAVRDRQPALLHRQAERGDHRPGQRSRQARPVPGLGGRHHRGCRRHPHGHLPEQPAGGDQCPVREARRHRVPPHRGHLHSPLHPLHPVRGLGGGLHHRGAAEERLRGAALHDPRGHAGAEPAGVQPGPPTGVRADAEDQELEGPELLPARQAGRVRAHRRAVRRAGPERHRPTPRSARSGGWCARCSC